MDGQIDLERRADGVVTLWIDNPQHRNALSNDLIRALTARLIEVGQDMSVRAVVIRGRGGIFSAGRQLRDLRAIVDADISTITDIYHELRLLNEAVYFCPHPTIAAVEKYAFGAGITVMSWCDIAIAEEGSLFAYPEVHHGIPPSPAIMALIRGIGRKAAMDLILTGRRFDAAEAKELGVITRTVARGTLDTEVEETVAGIMKGSADTIRRTKAFIWHAEDSGHRAAMLSAVDSISIGVANADTRERIVDFLERRKPRE